MTFVWPNLPFLKPSALSHRPWKKGYAFSPDFMSAFHESTPEAR